MLVLGRKENQSIIIGDSIRITIVGRCGSSVRIGVQAPRDVRVMREELQSALPPDVPAADVDASSVPQANCVRLSSC